MSIYKRGDIYWVEFQIAGRQIRRSARTTSKREAEIFERQLRTQVESDQRAALTGRSLKRTYGQALEKWLLSGAPESMYSHINATREYLKGVLLENLPAATADMKSAMLAKGLSPQTINRRLAVVRRVLRLAHHEWDWLRAPIAQKIALFSEKGYDRHIYLERDEVTALVGSMRNPIARRVALIAAYTGLRRGELLRLQPSNWRAPAIMLDAKTKGKKPRVVPLVSDLHPFMDALPFALTAHDLRKDFEAAREAVGMSHVRFHDLRHTFASWLAANPEIPLTVLRDLMGHSSLAQTSRYSHLRTDALARAIAALESPQKSAQAKRGRRKLKTVSD